MASTDLDGMPICILRLDDILAGKTQEKVDLWLSRLTEEERARAFSRNARFGPNAAVQSETPKSPPNTSGTPAIKPNLFSEDERESLGSRIMKGATCYTTPETD